MSAIRRERVPSSVIAKPPLGKNPTDAELNEALKWAIAKLREHRQTHVEWRDWFRRNPGDPRQDSLGDAVFHNETVQHYNSILAVLEAMLDVPAEVQP